MEIVLSQLVISLLALSTLVSPAPVQASIQPYSVPTQIALEYAKIAVVKSSAEFERIARCESYDAKLGRNDLQAKNPKSSAKGEFQFIKSTWKHYAMELWGKDWVNKDILSEDNRELAWYVYMKYGTKDWEADPKSKACWGKT